MKRLLGTLLLVWPLANAAAQSTIVEAPVIGVDPIVEVVTQKIPHEICHNERVKVVKAGGSHSATPSLLGAVIGGTLGGALGHDSRHQPVIAGAGALLGASIGHDAGHQQHTRSYYITEKNCGIDYELRDIERIAGYRVQYQYQDKIYITRTSTAPGETIRLRVELTPLN